MYDRFTDRARKIVALANQEAQRLNYEFVDPEHFLLGILIEGSGVACAALEKLEVNKGNLKAHLKYNLPLKPEIVTLGKLPNTIHTKKFLEYAIEAARNLDHNYVGSEHLLIGLTKCDSLAKKVLNDYLVTEEKAIKAVVSVLGIKAQEDIKELTNALTSVFKLKQEQKLSQYLLDVKEFMISAHGRQKRSNGSLYYHHPISVMNRLINAGITDEIVLATALCHDILEDTSVTEKEIEEIAGLEVLVAVKQLTNKVEPGTNFEEKHEALKKHASSFNDVAKRVKLADRYDNLADAVFEWEPRKVKRYAKAGLDLLDIMAPFPEDIKEFQKEATRFFLCLV